MTLKEKKTTNKLKPTEKTIVEELILFVLDNQNLLFNVKTS